MEKTKKRTNLVGMARSSTWLPETLVQAMELVKATERIHHSNQIELGLLMYFEKHRDLLKKNGIDPWKSRGK